MWILCLHIIPIFKFFVTKKYICLIFSFIIQSTLQMNSPFAFFYCTFFYYIYVAVSFFNSSLSMCSSNLIFLQYSICWPRKLQFFCITLLKFNYNIYSFFLAKLLLVIMVPKVFLLFTLYYAHVTCVSICYLQIWFFFWYKCSYHIVILVSLFSYTRCGY